MAPCTESSERRESSPQLIFRKLVAENVFNIDNVNRIERNLQRGATFKVAQPSVECFTQLKRTISLYQRSSVFNKLSVVNTEISLWLVTTLTVFNAVYKIDLYTT